ncbi:MAG: dephospho-CoA kinase [Halofilum sp. (in: g-proteobacteria)]|nr:dephospho-CoA kinase [Halofilum sp. (in: g-proteobacteria)]
MLEVCVTGGIAAGKSLVAARFRELGVPVADSDEAAREVVEPGSEGLARVVEAFGEELLTADGRLDRPALRRRIFDDDAARARLEGILHPLIGERIRARMDEWARAGHAYALRVVPLLVETGLHAACARVLVIDAPPPVQRARLLARDGGDPAQAERILARQATRWQRLAVATEVIDNGDAVDPAIALDPQVLALHRKYTRLAAAGGRTRA